ncbi:MAG: hypothetical protein AB7V62_03825 [Thermoleophilia bacterium]
MGAVRITSGPLRGVELESVVGGRTRRARLLVRAWRRRSQTPPVTLRPVAAPPERTSS